MLFVGNPRRHTPHGLTFNLIDYIELVDWTGRIIRQDKRGAINTDTPPILQRLDISIDHWIELSTKFESRFRELLEALNLLKHCMLTSASPDRLTVVVANYFTARIKLTMAYCAIPIREGYTLPVT